MTIQRQPVAFYVLMFLLAMFVQSLLASFGYEQVGTVKRYAPAHERDTTTYQLNFGRDGIITILVDDDQPFAKSLRYAKRVRVVLEPVDESERLER